MGKDWRLSWASKYIEALRKGETVQFRPTGYSMNGKIRSKQLITVSPFDVEISSKHTPKDISKLNNSLRKYEHEHQVKQNILNKVEDPRLSKTHVLRSEIDNLRHRISQVKSEIEMAKKEMAKTEDKTYSKSDLKKGDIVLCRVNGNDYLHLIKGMRNSRSKYHVQYQIGNNRGGINGWTSSDNIFGICTKIEN